MSQSTVHTMTVREIRVRIEFDQKCAESIDVIKGKALYESVILKTP